MARIAAGVEYDGRAYSGWQSQPGLDTVQDQVQRAFGRVAGRLRGLFKEFF